VITAKLSRPAETLVLRTSASPWYVRGGTRICAGLPIPTDAALLRYVARRLDSGWEIDELRLLPESDAIAVSQSRATETVQ